MSVRMGSAPVMDWLSTSQYYAEPGRNARLRTSQTWSRRTRQHAGLINSVNTLNTTPRAHPVRRLRPRLPADGAALRALGASTAKRSPMDAWRSVALQLAP